MDANDSSDYRSPYAFAVSRYSSSALLPLGYVPLLSCGNLIARLGKSDLVQAFLGISRVKSQDSSEPANGITNSTYSEVRSSHLSLEHPSAPYPALNSRRGTVFDQGKSLGGLFMFLEFGDRVVVVIDMESGQRFIIRCEAAIPLPALVHVLS